MSFSTMMGSVSIYLMPKFPMWKQKLEYTVCYKENTNHREKKFDARNKHLTSAIYTIGSKKKMKDCFAVVLYKQIHSSHQYIIYCKL